MTCGDMKVRYYARAHTTKPKNAAEVADLHKTAPIYDTNIESLDELVSLYEFGYNFLITDQLSNVVIIDLDSINPDFYYHVQQFLPDDIRIRRSASMKLTKCKIFKWYDIPFRMTGFNLHANTKAVLIELYKKEALTPEWYDSHMANNVKQMTFGLPRESSFVYSSANGQPFKFGDKRIR